MAGREDERGRKRKRREREREERERKREEKRKRKRKRKRNVVSEDWNNKQAAKHQISGTTKGQKRKVNEGGGKRLSHQKDQTPRHPPCQTVS